MKIEKVEVNPSKYLVDYVLYLFLVLMLLFICLLCDIQCHLTICSAEECPYDTKQICTRTYAVFFNIFDMFS